MTVEAQGMRIAFSTAGGRKDAAASILLQCAFELNRDEELSAFLAAYRKDVIIYPLFVLWCVSETSPTEASSVSSGA